MKFKKAFTLGLIAAGALTLSSGAHAQRVSKVTGNALGKMCTSKKGLILCNAYLSGVLDSEVWSRDYAVYKHDKAPVAFCVSKGAKTSQIREAVVSWLKRHNDALSQPAGKAIYRALHEAYPCGSKVKTSASVKEGSAQ